MIKSSNFAHYAQAYALLIRRSSQIKHHEAQTCHREKTLYVAVPTQDVGSEDGDENEDRGNWTGKLDFLLSAIGYAVGLGNVWRFPYKAYSNGGASFLIPYVIFLTFAGLPLFFMEMSLGQFASLGPISVWRVVPMLKGLGWAMVLISAMVAIYYNLIIAYTLYYLFASFTSHLPWQDCNPNWVQEFGVNCYERTNYKNLNKTMQNETIKWCKEQEAMNRTDFTNMTNMDYFTNCTTKMSPSEIYWNKVVLDISGNIDEGMGDFKWQLVLCLLLAWIIIFICLVKGIKSTGKVVYVTATFPYIILVILLIRGCTLDGALEGIKFYMIPKWEKMKNADVWFAAASQIFYSLGVAFGGLETMASYNKFKNNIYRDSLVVAILNCATSVFAGFVIFSVLGYMSVKTGLPVDKVADSGPGLAFIVYPEGISLMPVAPLWSILFFFMLFTLGLDSQFAMMETVISALVDEFPVLRKRKMWLTLGLCIALFLIGLPQCTRAGFYVMYLYEWYSASHALMIVAILEVLAISYIYGFQRFRSDIEMMIGFKPNYYWVVNWLFITPCLVLAILIFSLATASPISYGGVPYPAWADGMGWFMVAIAIAAIVITALVEYCKAHGFIEVMKKITQPTPDWGPALDKYRTGLYQGTHANENGKTLDYEMAEPPPSYHSNKGFEAENHM